jgi:hypothetical protein
MKRELVLIAILLWWAILLGWLAPALISMDDTLAVLIGIAVVLVSLYLTYRYTLVRILNLKVPKQ